MTKTYLIQACCLRPFSSLIEIEAGTPEEALAQARLEDSELLDAAEDCYSGYPWDEFAVYEKSGKRLLLVLDDDARLRNAALPLLETLIYVKATLKLRHIDEASDEEVEEALAMADKVIAQAQPASPGPML